ncbi:MAG TPA: 4-(cytidine 5'-diphospho)-2-C-methyl-D-erythritol kinase [Steroidobacteraceae bacterium]
MAAVAPALSWWPAPAKLNLFLHIVGRYADGYHELQTLFQLIDLCDRIGLRVRDDGRIERVAGMPEVASEHDLAVRAAQALQRHTGVHSGADLHVIKHIPLGGGLGGGSSDAATTLIGLNRLWGTGLAPDELARIGLLLGADVPVFVHGSSAWGEGRGERLQALSLPARWFLIIHPKVAVSTREIFQAHELTRNSDLITIRAFAEGESCNVCEPVVRTRYPAVAAALDWLDAQLTASGARQRARLTGTGACIFAAFEHEQHARQIAQRVPDGWGSFVARGLDRSPLHAMRGLD